MRSCLRNLSLVPALEPRGERVWFCGREWGSNDRKLQGSYQVSGSIFPERSSEHPFDVAQVSVAQMGGAYDYVVTRHEEPRVAMQ